MTVKIDMPLGNTTTLGELTEYLEPVRRHAQAILGKVNSRLENLLANLRNAFEDMLPAETVAQVAQEIEDYCDTVKALSKVLGMEFYIPYSTEWSGNDDLHSQALQEVLDENDDFFNENPLIRETLEGAIDTLETLEYNSYQWNNSNC